MTDHPVPPPSDGPIKPHHIHHHVPEGVHHAAHEAYHSHGHASDLTVASLNTAATPEHEHSGKKKDAHRITSDKPLTGLADPRIEKAPTAKAAAGAPPEHRKPTDVDSLNVRLGHKKDDPPANYLIDKQGHIKEQRSPDTKLNHGDKAVTIEVQAGSALNKDQQAALDGLVKAVKKDYPQSKEAKLTPEMQDAMDRTAAGPGIGRVPVEERGGNVGTPHGPKDWGSHAGNRGGNGGRVPSAAEARARGDEAPYSAPVDWSKMPHGLDRSKSTDRIAAMISANEGKPTTINWNDNGAGVSVGMFQANQKRGELPKLFSDFANTPDGYEALVEAFGPDMAARIKAHPEMIRGLNFNPHNELGQGLEKLVQNPAFQQLQLNQLRGKIEEAGMVAKEHGITSEAGVAMVADCINQFGSGGANKFLGAADGVSDQEQKARAIAHAINNRTQYGQRYMANLGKSTHDSSDPNKLHFDETYQA